MALSSRGAAWIAAIALALSGLALYWPSLSFDFVSMDDRRIVLDHPSLYDERSFTSSLYQIFVAGFPREEPLLIRDVSWAIGSRLFGFRNPWSYHLGNVLLNAANGPLLFAFLARATRRTWPSFAVAALWAVLPVHLEAVAWVMGRKDVLSAFLVLVVLLLEAEAERAEERRTRRVLRALSLVTYPLAILSKLSAVSLFLVIALYRALAPYLDGRTSPRTPLPFPELLRRARGVWPQALISAALFLWYRHVLVAWGLVYAANLPASLVGHLAMLAQFLPLVTGLYLKSLFVSSEHSITYLYPNTYLPLTIADKAISASVAVAVVACLSWMARRRRDLLFYGLSFFAMLLPYGNLLGVVLWRADRYVYLASFCVLAILVSVATSALDSLGVSSLVRGFVVAGVAGWAALSVLLVRLRLPVFTDDLELWTYEVSLPRPAIFAYQALARTLIHLAADERDPDKRAELLALADKTAVDGIAYFESLPWHVPEGAKERPTDYANIFVQRGRIAALRGESTEAQLEYYRRSYAVAPSLMNTLLLADTLADAAREHHDDARARESLAYFTQYVSNAPRDALYRAEILRRLDEEYAQPFPALADDVAKLREAYLR